MLKFDEDHLCCAACGEPNGLHHDAVDVFMRNADAPDGLHVTVSDSAQRVHICSDLDGNPSSRRGGIKIGFWCEICGSTSELKIAQHKGSEVVGFSVVKKAG